jgi:hypothetical protein
MTCNARLAQSYAQNYIAGHAYYLTICPFPLPGVSALRGLCYNRPVNT